MTNLVPKDPYKLYQYLNETYFENALPPCKTIKYITPDGSGKFLDARHMLGAVLPDENGDWHMELHAGLETLSRDFVALIMVHEMVHIKHPKKAFRHGTKVWKEEYRRLAGLGFFERLF